MDVLMSIKPKFVREILLGKKCYEYRKAVPKRKFDRVYIYESAPTKKIVAWFIVEQILKDYPDKIWSLTHEESGLSKDEFDNYFLGKEYAYALHIAELHVLDKPIDPIKIWTNFRAPQSFSYVEGID